MPTLPQRTLNKKHIRYSLIASQADEQNVGVNWNREETWTNGLPTVTYTCLEQGYAVGITLTYTPVFGGKHYGRWERTINISMGVEFPPKRQALADAVWRQRGEILKELIEEFPEIQMAGFPPVAS